jgi:alkylated DNA repair protein (DNA oxidative demethylase)
LGRRLVSRTLVREKNGRMGRLFEPDTETQPLGLAVRRDLVDSREQEELLAKIRELDLRPVVMRGQASRRLVRHFGLRYDYGSSEVAEGDPLPAWLEQARERCAGLAGLGAVDLAQTLVSHYPPGAGIGWHRDAPPFGLVVGLSLGSACEMRFRRGAGGRTSFTLELEPGAAYLLAGEARSDWQHSIPPVTTERWSVTFRTLRRPQN